MFQISIKYFIKRFFYSEIAFCRFSFIRVGWARIGLEGRSIFARIHQLLSDAIFFNEHRVYQKCFSISRLVYIYWINLGFIVVKKSLCSRHPLSFPVFYTSINISANYTEIFVIKFPFREKIRQTFDSPRLVKGVPLTDTPNY